MPVTISTHCPDYPAVTIALTRHDEPDELLCGALADLARQRDVLATVIVLDQCPSACIAEYCATLTGDEVNFSYHPIQPCGISRARNNALALSRTAVVLFTEPDARPDLNWAQHLNETLTSGAAVAGGRILPCWQGEPPVVTGTGLIRDLYSLLDLGTDCREVSKVVGCNFGINTVLLGSENCYFDEKYGRTPGTLMGGEEMELCTRALLAERMVMYDGRAVVKHVIGRQRLAYRWLVKRLYAAGRSRALKGGVPHPTNSPGPGWATLLALPLYLFYVCGFAAQKVQACVGAGRRPGERHHDFS